MPRSKVQHGNYGQISLHGTKRLEKGYRIQFVHRPPCFNIVVSTTMKPEQAYLLTQELSWTKGPYNILPLPDRDTGYYSRFFLVASNLISLWFELFSQSIQVQNTNNQNDCVSDTIHRFVLYDQSQGCIFSYINPAITQSSWGSLLGAILTKDGCSNGFFVRPGHPCFELHKLHYITTGWFWLCLKRLRFDIGISSSLISNSTPRKAFSLLPRGQRIQDSITMWAQLSPHMLSPS